MPRSFHARRNCIRHGNILIEGSITLSGWWVDGRSADGVVGRAAPVHHPKGVRASMSRRKLARRFEPRWGVSVPILEAEAVYVARERGDYLLLSLQDLRDKRAGV